jgi:predicted DCC family thiol-disulfide oxidoreductase YuxK
MKRLFVLYDGECRLCRRLRGWLAQRPVYVPFTFIPLQSPDLPTRFPGIEQFHPDEQLVVISEAGDLWRGESAWITVLWALQEYREWSLRLAHPTLRPLARKACALVSENRHGLSRWLRGASMRQVQDILETVAEEPCNESQHSTSKVLCRRR